jgi:hypothetical protein
MKYGNRYKTRNTKADFTPMIGDNKSQTVENDAMSIEELFERSTVMQNIPIEYNDDVQFDDIDLEEFGRLDLIEQHEILHDMKDRIDEFRKLHREQSKKVKEEEKLDNSKKEGETEE